MPPAAWSYQDRTMRLEGSNVLFHHIPDADALMAPELRAQAGRTLQAMVVQVCPGFCMSPAQIGKEALDCGYRLGTLAHLIELAVAHRDVAMAYRYVYATVGTARPGPYSTEIANLPFIGRKDTHSVTPALGVRAIRSDDQCFHGMPRDGAEAFLLIGENANTDDACCRGCTSF